MKLRSLTQGKISSDQMTLDVQKIPSEYRLIYVSSGLFLFSNGMEGVIKFRLSMDCWFLCRKGL